MGEPAELKLDCLAIGSLPHKNLDKAMAVIENNFREIPFCPQLTKINKNEDMIIQFLENMPSFFYGKDSLDTDYDEFYDDLEHFFMDYEEITTDTDSDALDKYAVSEKFSSSFPNFINLIKKYKPNFAKGQIVGPFTLATTLVDKDGRCAIYDETLKEIITKTLTLKALWQVKQIKKANRGTTPIIFIDEPSISQLGTSAFVTIPAEEVVNMFKEIAEVLKKHSAICAIHCCGKCDWRIPIASGVDIINLDAFSFAQNLSLFKTDVEKFLQNGGKIAWGVIPTLDKEMLQRVDLKILETKFNEAVSYLTKKGINEKLIIENSLITPSCGAGALSEELAEKAMNLTKQLSDILKERYGFDI